MMILNHNKIKYTYNSIFYIRLTIIAGLFFWFVSIPFLQLLYKDEKGTTPFLLIAPSLVVLLLLLFLYIHYEKIVRHFSSYKKFLSLSGPAIIFGLYLLYSALTLGYSISLTEDYIYGYGYWFSYAIAFVNVLLIYSFLTYFQDLLSVNYDENIVCLIGYYAAVIILLVIALVGMDKLLSNQRLEIILKASGIGLISLPIIFYPMAYKWNLTRCIFFLFAIFMLFKSDSRSAMLGAFIGVTVIYALKYHRYFILTLFLSGIIISYVQSDVYSIIDKFFLLSDKYRGISGNFSNREPIWEACWNIFLNHPLIGIGFRMSDKMLESQSMGSAHNVYLMILMETGIIGSILIFLSIIYCLIILGKKAWKNKDKTSLFYIGLLSGTLAFGIGERFLINVGNLSSILLFFALFHAHIRINYNRLKAVA